MHWNTSVAYCKILFRRTDSEGDWSERGWREFLWHLRCTPEILFSPPDPATCDMSLAEP